ncbi:MAG: succinyl-diaminopimelate desuccinylase [bacterium]|nr:succinyl-diaminopimelate desuccinylase [bacterium]
MSDLSNLLLELLSIPSETGREQNLSKFVFERLAAQSAYCCQQQGLSLTYRGPLDPEKQTLGFFGHLDTVQDQQTLIPQIKGDRVYGCGASDMKAGLAVMMSLMQQDPAQSAYNLVFVFYDKEEGPYLENGLEPVLSRQKELSQIDLAFALEPTDNRIEMGCMGGLHALVTFKGQSAHSARPWQGENALHAAWPLLKRLSEQKPKEVVFGGLPFFEVINATQGTTDNRRNSIPGHFTLNLNYRFAPGKEMELAKQELLDLVGEGPEVLFVDECPSAPVVDENPLFARFLAATELPVQSKQAWTDIARLAVYGIDGVNLGPGRSDQAHQKDEWTSIQDLEKNHRIFSNFLFGAP